MSNDTITQDSDPTPQTAPPAIDPRLLVRQEGVKGYVDDFVRKVRGGDLGSIPVVAGLIIIWLVFGMENSRFFSADTFSNISFFLCATGMASLGLVFVLILGEIDLSIMSVSGLSAAVFATLSVSHGMNTWLAVVLTVLTGTAIGAIHGFFFARIGVPAFVVTLAGNLGWNGLMLYLLNTGSAGGSISIPETGFMNMLGQSSFFLGGDIAGAYILAGIAVALLLGSSLLQQGRRRKAGIPFKPTAEILLRTALLAVAAFGAAYIVNQANGVYNALVFFLVCLAGCDFTLRRTSFGRKVFAVGGNIEAARRSGISVPNVRLAVLAISGTFGALSGLFFAAWQYSATLDAGTGNWLMLAIAAAVIGGTSLFGGRGKAWAALLGVLVIQSITTGLQMLNMGAAAQYMITAGVLLVAVVIDSISRKTQKAAGRG